jgi:hypothetical protein
MSLAALLACSVHENKNAGQGEQVQIRTPVASLNVDTGKVNSTDTGLSVYPGARLAVPSRQNDSPKANVQIESPLFGLKVISLKYQANDSPEKVKSFYQNELKKYGEVLECPGEDDAFKNVGFKAGQAISCYKNAHGEGLALKAGTEDREHAVAIKPSGNGAEFTLIYVSTEDKTSKPQTM